MARTIENKISIATVYGKIARAELYKEENGGRLPIMRVVGVATGFKNGKTIRQLPSGEMQESEWIALTGQFAATNLATGQVFRAGKCFLPQSATSLVHGAMQGENVKGVEFAFEVHALRDDDAATGYVYETSSLIEPDASDPLEKMMLAAAEKSKLALTDASEPEPEKEHAHKGKEKANA